MRKKVSIEEESESRERTGKEIKTKGRMRMREGKETKILSDDKLKLVVGMN